MSIGRFAVLLERQHGLIINSLYTSDEYLKISANILPNVPTKLFGFVRNTLYMCERKHYLVTLCVIYTQVDNHKIHNSI